MTERGCKDDVASCFNKFFNSGCTTFVFTDIVFVDNLIFGKTEVLKGIDLEVKEGEVVCLIGPSGSGKSTVLRCINKLENATSGTILVDGFEITNKKVDINLARQNIGMVFQQFNLFNHMTVKKNIMFAPLFLILQIFISL